MMSLKYRLYAGCFAAALLTGCSAVDEDLDDCAAEVRINYEMRLVTNKSTEMDNVLNHATDQYVSAALQDYLKGIFTDRAHDVDLPFYRNDVDDKSLLSPEKRIMDDSRATYSFYLPVRPLMHLAVANSADNKLVSYSPAEQYPLNTMPQVNADTITSHTTGLFTGRLPFEVLNEANQEFNMYLYMANCAAALVVDTTNVDVKDIRVYTTGFATDFNLCDSTYTYGKAPIVVADRLPVTEGKKLMFCSVNYPSSEVANIPTQGTKDTFGTRVVIETTEPFEAPEAENAYWQYRCYVTKADGKITETILSVRKPLRAGQLTIVKSKVEPDGSVIPMIDGLVGVTVNLDWNPGGTYNPIF